MKKTPEDPRDPTPAEDAAKQLGDAVIDRWMREEGDRLMALTPEEQDAELRALGFDPALERARGQAVIDLLRGSSEGQPLPGKARILAKKLLEHVNHMTPEEGARAWNAAVDMCMHDRAEEAEAMSPEELDAELRAMGCDPAAERAKGEALAEELRRRGGTRR